MSHHRRRRRKRRSTFGKRGAALFIGVSLMMLVLILVILVPGARRQQISAPSAILLALLLWVACVFAVWACIRSRRRRYTHGRSGHVTTHTDYSGSDSEFEDEESFADDPAAAERDHE